MNDRIKAIDFKYKLTTYVFFFFLIVAFLSPLGGVDWSSYLLGKEGFLYNLKNLDVLDGRIISSFFINIFSYNKIWFNLIIALVTSLFVFRTNTLLGVVKNKFMYVVTFLLILLVSVDMFAYNYVSVSGAFSYTIPIFLSFIYFYNLFNVRDKKRDYRDYIMMVLISSYVITSSFFIAIAFVIANIFYLICNYSKEHLLVVILDILILLFVFSTIKNNIFIFDINYIFNNIPKFIENTFSRNILLVLLSTIPINFYLGEKLKGIYSRIPIVLFNIVLYFSLIYNFAFYSPVSLTLVISRYNGFFAVENWYYIFYYLLYFYLLIRSIHYYIKDLKSKKLINTLFIFSILVSLFSLISQNWNLGNNFAFTLFLITSLVMFLNNKELNINKRVVFLTGLLVVYYLFSFVLISYFEKTRGEYIKEQLDTKQNIIEIKANPLKLVYKFNPINNEELNELKKYYEIPLDKNAYVRYMGIFEKIERRIKE